MRVNATGLFGPCVGGWGESLSHDDNGTGQCNVADDGDGGGGQGNTQMHQAEIFKAFARGEREGKPEKKKKKRGGDSKMR